MKCLSKTHVARLWIIFLLTGLSMFATSALSSAAVLKIGDSYGGGVVLYVDATGQHGLIAAKADMIDRSSGKDMGYFTWYSAKNAVNAFEAGYCDWLLPNKEQLKQLYINRTLIGGLENTYYWSSSESGLSQAWAQDFSTGEQLDGNKTNTARVRAVRFF